mmetsp:Transcript_1250/g.3637  ORF Transcript_1250/g.3637 Transcript_1250/m.3637 type:complete len:232 (-) Transcript_1250:945-1640(-)
MHHRTRSSAGSTALPSIRSARRCRAIRALAQPFATTMPLPTSSKVPTSRRTSRSLCLFGSTPSSTRVSRTNTSPRFWVCSTPSRSSSSSSNSNSNSCHLSANSNNESCHLQAVHASAKHCSQPHTSKRSNTSSSNNSNNTSKRYSRDYLSNHLSLKYNNNSKCRDWTIVNVASLLRPQRLCLHLLQQYPPYFNRSSSGNWSNNRELHKLSKRPCLLAVPRCQLRKRTTRLM